MCRLFFARFLFAATILTAADYYNALDPRLEQELAPKRQALEEWLPIVGHNLTDTIRKALDIIKPAKKTCHFHQIEDKLSED